LFFNHEFLEFNEFITAQLSGNEMFVKFEKFVVKKKKEAVSFFWHSLLSCY